MGAAWAGLWLLPSMIVGSAIVGELEPEHIGGAIYAGVPCGFVFSLLSGHASSLRRWVEMSATRAFLLGALSGPILVAILLLLGSDADNGWRLWVPVTAALSIASALTAVGSYWANRGVVSLRQ